VKQKITGSECMKNKLNKTMSQQLNLETASYKEEDYYYYKTPV